jgi:L-iditol 2-dehydrogenase
MSMRPAAPARGTGEGARMLEVAIRGPRRAELVQAQLEPLPEGWARVKILAAPLCAEYKLFRQGGPYAKLGHEAAGVVVEAAPGSTVQPGDRVVVMPQYPCGRCDLCLSGDYIYCRLGPDRDAGTLAQFIDKPSWLLLPVPPDMDLDRASLACCGLGPSFGVAERLGVDRFDTVLVTGLGPVGLGAVLNAVARGARVIGVEGNQFRADLARELGADVVLDPALPDLADQVRQAAGGDGPTRGIECSGTVAAQRLQIEAAARLGRIGFIGECRDELPIRVSPDLIRKGLTLIGSWHYPLPGVPRVLRLLAEMPQAERMITHRFDLSQIDAALRVSEAQRCGKIIVHPWGGEGA